MDPVFGASLGAASVRIVRADSQPETGSASGRFLTRTVDAYDASPVRTAAIHLVAAVRGDTSRMVIAVPDERQNVALESELRARGIEGAVTVSEAVAVVALVRTSGAAEGFRLLTVLDIGRTGVTVSMIEIGTATTIASTRSTALAGDRLDGVVAELLSATTADAALDADAAFDAREVKEYLASGSRRAQVMPVPESMCIRFDSVVTREVEDTLMVIREVAARARCVPDALVLVGGGARISLVEKILEREFSVPVIRPAEPELASAKGAALIAEVLHQEHHSSEVSVSEVSVSGVSDSEIATDAVDMSSDQAVVRSVGETEEGTESDSLPTGGLGRMQILVGVGFSLVALTSFLAWAVLRPFSDPAQAEPPLTQTTEIVAPVPTAELLPPTTTKAIDPLTERNRAPVNLVRSWRY
ncbi:Hsp70 family protein [Rhodococcus erythropolis]|uniref:Hsp70 family protein n=1 Tax=Rhodococcus erythropolis TaxID=1833 RepID=UPI00222781FD|nr:Hsp70 family protein [Rhodococcus erythropolis]MCW2296562.1 actin-like ATPase involved in cell morphogenesis [Rhodococcus erythropolis]MDJ0404802.1 Hsp70 family protein [Rhodococcus erythropolis]